MRKQLMCALAALGAISMSAATAQAELAQTSAIKIDKSKSGTAKKPVGIKIKVATTTAETDPAKAAPGTVDVSLTFPKGLVFNGAMFPSCSAAVLNSTGPSGCPSGSKVGSGTALGRALDQDEDIKITAFNGPGGNKLNVFLFGSTPLQINSAMVGTLKKTPAGGYKLVLPIPANLQQPIPGVFAVLSRFNVTVGGPSKTVKGVKRHYLESVGCPKKSWAFLSAFNFTDGQSKTIKGKQTCS